MTETEPAKLAAEPPTQEQLERFMRQWLVELDRHRRARQALFDWLFADQLHVLR